MKIVAIIQARMGSSRLPQKVLKDLVGATVLDRVLNRLGRSELIGELLVATTTEPADDAIVEHCERRGCNVFRGSELDVLDRYYHAAKSIGAEVVVRITSDCPVIDPGVADATIGAFLEKSADYASNVLVRTYPRGLDTEVMTVQALERAWRESKLGYQRAHVTPYIYENPGEFNLHGVENDADCSWHRWTVDTPEDLRLLQAIYTKFSGQDDFGWREILDVVQADPLLSEINRHVSQKAVHEG
jgi:spore coat polysaccharide biosynthesis protein SpsF